eukprot:764374-Hanusia_phi.AAC.1
MAFRATPTTVPGRAGGSRSLSRFKFFKPFAGAMPPCRHQVITYHMVTAYPVLRYGTSRRTPGPGPDD